MPSSSTNTFLNFGLEPVYPGVGVKIINVALDATLTLARGTVLGEIQRNDVWLVTLGTQTSGNFTLTFGGQTAYGPDANDSYTLSTGTQGSGTFTLSFGGQTTSALARNASAATIQTAFLLLSSVGAGNATVTLTSGTPGTDAVYTITLISALAKIANTAVTADFSSMGTPGNASLTKATTGSGGTAGFAYNAASATLQTAFLALSTVGAGNATITGSAGGPYTLTFISNLGLRPNGAVTAGFSTLTTPGNASIAHSVTGKLLGTFKAYNDNNTDGSQVARGILQFDCATDSSGNVTLGTASGGGPYQQTQPYAPMFIAGSFAIGDITGLDAAGVTDLGRIIEGTLAAGGTFRMP